MKQHDPDTLELFEMWYSNEMLRLFNYVAYLVRDRAAAEDLASAICERAMERLHQYDAHRGNLDAWRSVAGDVSDIFLRDLPAHRTNQIRLTR